MTSRRSRCGTRLRIELDAPVADVWGLMGDLSRFPEYSVGLKRVDATLDEEGRCVEYTCHFKRIDGNDGAVSRDVMKWYEPNRGTCRSKSRATREPKGRSHS